MGPAEEVVDQTRKVPCLILNPLLIENEPSNPIGNFARVRPIWPYQLGIERYRIELYGSSRCRYLYRYRYMFLADISADTETDIFG